MFKKILLTLVLIAGVLAVIISKRPSEFRVTRSALMSAPPAKVFAQVNDLHAWHEWSPWAKMDPNAKESFEGPMSGIGAKMSWTGNMKVGEGSMTIIDSHASDLVRFRLDFVKPMAGTNTVEFTFQPQGKDTLVTWAMFGPNNFVAKAMSLVMDCDKMVGGEFDKGLAQLKSIVETPVKK